MLQFRDINDTRRTHLAAHSWGPEQGARMHIDVVIPAYNEEDRIDRTLELYRNADLGGSARFLAALDGCSDRTAAVVRDHARTDPPVQLLEFPKLHNRRAPMNASRRSPEDALRFVTTH